MALTQNVQSVVLTLMEGFDSARSLTVAILVRYGEWDQLTQLTLDPSQHLTAASYLRWAGPTELLRKFDGFDLPIDREIDTFQKWIEAEQMCAKTNARLSTYVDCGPFGGPTGHERIAEFFRDLKKWMIWLIGAKPPEMINGAFGPGATVSDPSRISTIPDKMSSVPTFTTGALWFLVPWIGTKWATACADLSRKPVAVRGNTYFQVPKHSRINRSCGKEPSINGFYQLGVGRVMRQRLKARGIDLVNGQSIHQQVAGSASLSADFVTIDLSSASDTVASNLVKLALPHGWYELLASLRSPMTQVKGTWYRLEKFSSMGNGYTFELETALFTAICLSVAPWLTPGVDLFVYGDDIIVPRDVSDDVIAALRYSGFKCNVQKTFTDGPFRESCGGDFFLGRSVRAYYLQEDPNEPQKLIGFANGISRMVDQDHGDPCLHDDLRRAWFRVLDCIPSAIRRCRGPKALGDLVIHDDEARWQIRWRSSIRWVRVYRPASFRRVRWEGYAYSVQMAAALYGVAVTEVTKRRIQYVTPRDSVLGYKVGWTPFS